MGEHGPWIHQCSARRYIVQTVQVACTAPQNLEGAIWAAVDSWSFIFAEAREVETSSYAPTQRLIAASCH